MSEKLTIELSREAVKWLADFVVRNGEGRESGEVWLAADTALRRSLSKEARPHA